MIIMMEYVYRDLGKHRRLDCRDIVCTVKATYDDIGCKDYLFPKG
jgi:hypothetical protein